MESSTNANTNINSHLLNDRTNAYVINLERDFLKKQNLEQNIKEKSIDTHLNIIFKKAVNGSDATALSKYSFKICPTWFDPDLKTGIRTGEIGCALSHYDCWLDFYNSNKPHALFLEDDVAFTDNFTEQYNNLLQYPDNTDIVYIKRKPLNADKETKYNSIFINSKTSYWLCGYLLTRKGVEQLLNTNYLQNVIVIDEFLPILYDSDYLQQYKKYYNDIHLTAYSLVDSFIDLVDGTFLKSSTFHSNYYEYESRFLALVSYKNCSFSTIDRFDQSCKKMSVNIKNIDFNNIINEINKIDDNKIIILADPHNSFILNNPAEIYLTNEDSVYSNFSDVVELLDKLENGELCFYGKNKYLKQIMQYGKNKYNNIDRDSIITTLEYSENKEYSVPKINSLLIHSKHNYFLLNNYENYFLNKILKNYGFTQNRKNNNELCTHKIRVNVMIYSDKYLQTLNYLEKIDYDVDLLDIYIYTNSTSLSVGLSELNNISGSGYNVIVLSEQDAYNQVYTYYTKYDYVWFIKSEYIIFEPSLLKDCICSNKTITSGIIRKKNDLFSNFWGNTDPNGYYKRSNDYIDILNQDIINIWNVPYISGNILFKSKIFKYPNLFKNVKYDDVDIALCANIRNKNESMYLLNQKLYGHVNEFPNAELNLHNWTEEKILHPDFYNFYYGNNIDLFTEIGSDIWSIPFFSSAFCDYLIKISEAKGDWSAGVYSETNKLDKRTNGVEEIPTQDIHLKQLDLHDFWTHVTNNYMKKILSHLYKYLTKEYNIAFIVKYDASPGGQRSLKPHHDSSVYTINIALNNSTEYKGGGVRFISKNLSYVNKTAGHMLLHPGRITHYHEALPITEGKRYVLVSFNQ